MLHFVNTLIERLVQLVPFQLKLRCMNKGGQAQKQRKKTVTKMPTSTESIYLTSEEQETQCKPFSFYLIKFLFQCVDI